MHCGKRTSGMKPISFRWLLSSGSWKAIIWEKTVKYSAAQTKEHRVNTSAIVSAIPNGLQAAVGREEILSGGGCKHFANVTSSILPEHWAALKTIFWRQTETEGA